MIIKSTAGVAFAVVCLTAIATLSGAHAQMGGPPPGSYWAPPAPLWLRARPLRPPTKPLCPAEPVCPAIGWNPADNQRPTGQPG